ncbi:PadR family transcriptional regulator [Gordonia sp. DT218]|uniref:PadR family transcriptional regulator n=1 Tax=unclassified Gordonia (in: high G+C Gram-positive bacteria) TaxID=2657482 RepID=UPI003CF50B7E
MGAKACGPLPPLAVLVLGLVAERPMHPYEMFQTTVERREDRLAKFRPGTMYHTVDRLLSQELIEVHDVQRAGNRPERTVYAITDLGRRVLFESLEEIVSRHPVEYPELYLALSEAHGLPRARVVELLTTRLEAMRTALTELDGGVAAVRERGTPEMFHLDIGCRIATLRAQIDWVEDLVDRLENSSIEWLDDPGSPYQGSSVIAGVLHQKANDE